MRASQIRLQDSSVVRADTLARQIVDEVASDISNHQEEATLLTNVHLTLAGCDGLVIGRVMFVSVDHPTLKVERAVLVRPETPLDWGGLPLVEIILFHFFGANGKSDPSAQTDLALRHALLRTTLGDELLNTDSNVEIAQLLDSAT